MGLTSWQVRLGVGVAAGVGIAYVDNETFQGEVSPIVIVAMLLGATTTAAIVWGRRSWITVAATWIAVPLVHLVKHVFGLPDTLHPNTYGSILMLAGFTFVVAALGAGAGMLVHRSVGGTGAASSGPGNPGGS
jgi:hypothetical protein